MKISYFDFAILNHQLGALLRSGLSTPDALKAIAGDITDKQFRQNLTAIAQEIEKGRPLSEAIEQFQGTFPSYYSQILKASEESGTTPEVLTEMGHQAQSLDALRQKLSTIMVYPAVILLIALLIGGFLISFVTPMFLDMYSTMNLELPGATKVLVSLYSLFSYLPFLLTVVCSVIFFSIFYTLHTYNPKIHAFVEKFIRFIPLFNKLFFHFAIVTFLKLLRILLRAKTPLPQALKAAAEGSHHQLLIREVEVLAKNIESGQTLPDSLKKATLLPQTLVWLLSMGAKESEFEGSLKECSELFELKTEIYHTTVASIAEPVLVLSIGAIVGFIIISQYTPLLTMVNLLP